MRQRDFDLIVAIDSARGIGKNNDLPWDLPGDMAHFVSQTKTAAKGRRNAVIMGRKNWDAIPPKYRPLSGRYNIVLTRSTEASFPDGVAKAASFDQALTGLPADIDRVYVIGGGNVYAQAIKLESCRRIYLTQIDHDFECDVFFPPFDHRFERVNVFGQGEDGGISYQIELWERPPRGDG